MINQLYFNKIFKNKKIKFYPCDIKTDINMLFQ